ncbi:hypothetical protein LTR37_017780 [Vermiconidia calcicola]|uniref:Uncharacterized protein n=1 Tax=Vermiconidia calcicola TaxID=1690605 RepID=A0ACC3MK43_9PEZI|nr:hypothetical protein LTR37_017780 [Vermiconidia calcicola]
MSQQDVEQGTRDDIEPVQPESTAIHCGRAQRRVDWKAMLGNRKNQRSGQPSNRTSMSDLEQQIEKRPAKWSMGILNDEETEEVPGSILLLSKVSEFNEPLGIRNAPARTTPSLRSSFSRRMPTIPEKKRTSDGKFILEPQPEESPNDPLNWSLWRRDLALLSLGFYCMVGGGITPILAAGFDEVGREFGVSDSSVALTTGLYMMGLGIGSVLLSPTAILYGKRPVYLCAAICFILTSVWAALSPNFISLVVARIFMGLAVSSVECLPSASVAEIYFLHEKAYRLGIYTLLLLGGKNLVPLVSAAIIQTLGWRWVFWIVACVVGLGFVLLFVFVPETFWDRTPIPHKHTIHRFPSLSLFRTGSIVQSPTAIRRPSKTVSDNEKADAASADVVGGQNAAKRHAHFQTDEEINDEKIGADNDDARTDSSTKTASDFNGDASEASRQASKPESHPTSASTKTGGLRVAIPASTASPQPPVVPADNQNLPSTPLEQSEPRTPSLASAMSRIPTEVDNQVPTITPNPYTEKHRAQPPKTFVQQLKPWNGRIRKDSWIRVATRPFILFCYPSILWSTLVYSLSIGWLIVLSESVSHIYENKESYNFDSLQTGLVYISPFIGGILGTAVAGKLSDVVVRYMSRKNGGIYEPEFRLVMGFPIAIFTTIGLMGYGWSAQERDLWIVPTIFFGFISFGCSLGSTTAITFAVDSYRQYAGEALVTLNFSKNIFHGLVFSLFFNRWLEGEGSKNTFVAIGAIQLVCMLTTIPMYIYGKRARMWSVRKNLMEKF